jgi:hypothetical protein
VACGNNKVSRGMLSSQPRSTAQQGRLLFNETRRAPEQVMVTNKRGKFKLVDAMYSQSRKDGTVDRFLDENRNETFNASLHIHEIFEPSGDVFLHITDRRGFTPAQKLHEIPLRAPSAKQVQAAEMRLAAILGDLKSGKR